MDDEYKPTLFDTQTQNHSMQILKAMIPYLDAGKQKPFALIIKYMELQKTAQMFSSQSMTIQSAGNESAQDRMFQMLADIGDQCSASEKENIDMMLNMFQMMSAYDTMFS